VSLVFFITWLPLNICNLLEAIFNPFSGDSPEGHRMLLIIYASCHLLAMTSVCTNPVMYGFLNENFKQFFKICLRSRRAPGQRNGFQLKALTGIGSGKLSSGVE